MFAVAYTAGMVKIPEGEWLTVAEAARSLRVSARRVQALAKLGRLRAVLTLGRYLIDRASVAAYKATDRKPGRPRKGV